jgi:hypothetical protein
MNERSNDDTDREALPNLTETQRKVVKVAKAEAVRAIEKKYNLSSLIPFLAEQKAEHDTNKLIRKKVTDWIGVDRKDRNKLVLLVLLIALFCLILGPTHAFSILIKEFG